VRISRGEFGGPWRSLETHPDLKLLSNPASRQHHISDRTIVKPEALWFLGHWHIEQ
jgi:hypothetical protein